jgi:hypothetical protein
MVTVAFDSSYPTGGEPIEIRDLGLKFIESIEPQGMVAGYSITWNRRSETDHRLRVYLPSSSHSHDLNVTEASFNDLRVVYMSPALGLVVYDADTTAVQSITIDSNTSAVAVEVAAGTDLSALVGVTCKIVGW